MSLILSIDQSTSATKAVIFDTKGRLVDRASRNHRQIYPQPGWVEHDPEEIWQNVLSVIREVAGRNPQISGISITNQRETIVVFERATGRPLHNAIVWQCRRGEAICNELSSDGRTDLVTERTGLKIDTYFSASKLVWLMREDAGLAAKLRFGAALFGTMDTYLIHRLTGGRVFATDATNASRTLFYNIRTLQWDTDLCSIFDITPALLSEVRESTAHFGETNANGILPRPVPICGVMGDSQAALFAQCCFEPGMAKATLGTGTSLLLNVGETPRPAPEGLVSALAWISQGRAAYACEGLINTSAATVAWLKDQLQIIKDPAETEALALSVPDNGGVYFVPAFAGLGAPYWNAGARAAVLGLTAYHSRAHIVRAALESIAFQIRDVLDLMRSGTGVSLLAVRADGGPTGNTFLMQACADITQTDFIVSEVAEASALGAAFAGMLALGIHENTASLINLPRNASVYHPKLTASQAENLRLGWLDAVRRVL